MLDEHLQKYGTLAAGGRPAVAKKDEATAAPAKTEEKTEDKKPPVNLLAKVSLPAAGATDMAVSTDTAGDKPGADDGRAAGTTAAEPVAPAPEKAVAAVSTDRPADAAPGGVEPVKASLGTGNAPAPGHCEHRWVCLPGTPKPTIMLMCPGKGGGKPDTGAAVAGDAPASPEGAAGEQETAALGAAATDAKAPAGDKAADNKIGDDKTVDDKTVDDKTVDDKIADDKAADSVTANDNKTAGDGKAAAAAPDVAAADVNRTADGPAPESRSAAGAAAQAAAPAVQPESTTQEIRSGGVADWNWSYDPSKRYR
jgi:hypothetical protein